MGKATKLWDVEPYTITYWTVSSSRRDHNVLLLQAPNIVPCIKPILYIYLSCF